MADLTTRVRLKAEWEKQLAIFMAFPHQNSDWAKHLGRARACFLDIIEHIVCFESVILCVDTQDDEGFEIVKKHFSKALDSADSRDSVNADFMKTQDDECIKNLFNQSVPYTLIQNPKSKYLANFGGNSAFSLHIVRVPTNDTWARDFGAISVELESPQNLAENPSQNMAQNKAGQGARQIQLLDFTFNGWGLKYPAFYDNTITRALFRPELTRQMDMVLEGGSIDSNGAGVLLTNTQCLLESNRNPHLSQVEIESKLKKYFGLDSVLWLTQGYLAGDDTDSHIDTLARFISKDTIAYVKCEDEKDEHFQALRLMESELQVLKQANGEPYKLVALPFTRAIFDENGERLPASYANFLFVNGALLVPTYDDINDEKALKILDQALPSHRVVGIDCHSLILWHGSLHCVTMQMYGETRLK
ncbi:agmatine deiminase family protein [Helicobacter cinaedi]|uniref:Agmatine deiminase n=1 Tax=Helicobacter cinaedi TaxID=213 RepID=A0A377JR43_9HELI|nr:agmatine deiminase family protein [Helicobacter cinaedi]STP09492.1 Agmatine deiminase [Helicobacter cinaedi]